MTNDPWPIFSYDAWAPTKKTLHMAAQMIGKARLALSPPQPEWLHTCLYLDGHGFTTGAMPSPAGVVSMGIDVYRSELWVRVGDGRAATVPLGPRPCVADIWTGFQSALAGFGLNLDIWEKPQEVSDVTLFSENRQECMVVAEEGQRFLRLLASIGSVFEEFRSRFFGRSGVQFWWGGFDFAVLLFTGKHEEAPRNRGYILRYDLDAEHLNAGFWPGDDGNPTPGFYGYLVPRPDGCENAAIEPEYAGWVEAMGEWMMPYEAVRGSPDPRRTILSFLEAVYDIAVKLGGWDATALTYEKPAPRRADAGAGHDKGSIDALTRRHRCRRANI